jgi:hypothetical protein
VKAADEVRRKQEEKIRLEAEVKASEKTLEQAARSPQKMFLWRVAWLARPLKIPLLAKIVRFVVVAIRWTWQGQGRQKA